jgi:hypothetical protein
LLRTAAMLDPFPPPANGLSPADDPAALLPTSTTPSPSRVRRAIVKGLLLGLLVGAATGVASFAMEYLHKPAPLPVFGPVPAFQLVDQGGQPFDNARLAGAPWIAGFIFTACTDTCPLITARMVSLQRKLTGTAVRLAWCARINWRRSSMRSAACTALLESPVRSATCFKLSCALRRPAA